MRDNLSFPPFVEGVIGALCFLLACTSTTWLLGEAPAAPPSPAVVAHNSNIGHPPLGISARASVVRVIDGDTIEVVVSWPMTIRLKDCWAPETRGEERPRGLASKAYMESLLSPGDSVVFFAGSDSAESLGDMLTFGRVIGKVWRSTDTMSVGDRMIEAGFATETKQ